MIPHSAWVRCFLSCHPDRSSGAFLALSLEGCRCAVEGSRQRFPLTKSPHFELRAIHLSVPRVLDGGLGFSWFCTGRYSDRFLGLFFSRVRVPPRFVRVGLGFAFCGVRRLVYPEPRRAAAFTAAPSPTHVPISRLLYARFSGVPFGFSWFRLSSAFGCPRFGL